MSKGMKSTLTRRLLAAVLALVVGITFMPVLGAPVFADDGQGDGQQVEKSAAEDAIPAEEAEEPAFAENGQDSDDAAVAEAKDAEEVTSSEQQNKESVKEKKAEKKSAAEAKEVKGSKTADKESNDIQKSLSQSKGSKNQAADNYGIISVTAPDASGIVTVTGKVTQLDNTFSGGNFKYSYLYVDGRYVRNLTEGKTFGPIYIDMKDYPVGYHTISVEGTCKSTTNYPKTVWGWENKYVPTYIYARPANNLSQYTSYHNRFFFTSGAYYTRDYDVDQYMDYKMSSAKTWSNFGRMEYANREYYKAGLRPNTYYQARVYYGKKFTYNGRDYFWSGPKSIIRTIKTGVATTPIKSFKLKAYKVKRHTVKNRSYYFGYFYAYKHTTRWHYYTYKLKAIVKFKKKPGAAGVNICGKWVPGNKKKYTVNLGGPFTSYVKPKKLTRQVSVYTYQNRVYGGYSPLYKVTKKMK